MARRKKNARDVHGILLLDKRLGVSSNKALQEVRSVYQANKAGHTGSLDPLATGLLPICFGEATKVSALMLDQDKRYEVVVKLGVITDSGDAEGKVLATHAVPAFDREQLTACLEKFTGSIAQVPPMYSALKHHGKRLYELAREGQVVERKARSVSIYKLQYLSLEDELLHLDVSCSKGTYIRSLAEDIGQQLGCGATVAQLRRRQVGQFSITDAYTLEQLQRMSSANELSALLLPVDEPLSAWPTVNLAEQQAVFIRQGRQILLTETCLSGSVRMYCKDFFIGIGEVLADGRLQPKRVFNI